MYTVARRKQESDTVSLHTEKALVSENILPIHLPLPLPLPLLLPLPLP